MLQSRYLLLSIVILFAAPLWAQTDPLNSLQECRMRQGLPNFFAKLKAGGPLTIAYFGGSITSAGGGWRDQSAKWFQQQYPAAKITQINAGVGGTGSDLGVFRLQRDVLAQKPDLVFVEFAVNDGGPYIHQTIEGIVRQIWRANPQTDICFVYTIAGNMLPTLQENHLMPSMLAMEHIAQHYNIPSIQMGLQVLSLIREDKLVFLGKPEQYPGKLVFTGDNVHPNTHTGHRLYTEAVIRAMQSMSDKAGAVKHTLIEPYTKDNWEDAKMIPLTNVPKKGAWQDLTNTKDSIWLSFKQKLPTLFKSNEPGAALQVRFKGRLAGIYDLVGPGCGQYAITIDGQQPKLYPRFDRHASTYRSHYFFIPLLDFKEHNVDMQVAAEKLDKMTILQKGGATQPGNPLKYEENACYAGWLLLLGDLTNE